MRFVRSSGSRKKKLGLTLVYVAKIASWKLGRGHGSVREETTLAHSGKVGREGAFGEKYDKHRRSDFCTTFYKELRFVGSSGSEEKLGLTW